MNTYLFYKLYPDSKSIKMACVESDNIVAAYNHANFMIYSANEIFLEIMEMYKLIDVLESWIKDSTKIITKSRKDVDKYKYKLSSIGYSDNNIILNYVINTLYNNFTDYRKELSSNSNLVKHILDSWIYFPQKKKELKQLQENIVLCIGANALIEETDETITFKAQNLVVNDISKYIDINGNVFNVVSNNLLPLIIDIIAFISEHNLAMQRCVNCNRHFIIDGSEKKKTCSESCKKEHYKNLKKYRLERDSIKYDTEYLYTTFTKRCMYRKKELLKINADNKIISSFDDLIKSQSENLLSMKKKVNSREIDLNSFTNIAAEYEAISKKVFVQYKEDIKNGEHKKTQ